MRSFKKDKNFDRKTEEVLVKMDLIKDMDFPMDINLIEIIAKGEEIKEDKRRIKFELLGFVSMCLFIITGVAMLIISTNPRIFIYLQAALVVLLPLVVIPIASKSSSKEHTG